jgi:hypothetical protein
MLAPNHVLMNLIRVSEIQDVTALLLNRNLVPRFTKGGVAQETMMNDNLTVEIREYWNSQEEDLRGFPCSFSFRASVTEPVAESGDVVFIT